MLGWVSLFLILILIEAFIGDFSALAISIGAIAGITIALLNFPFYIQVACFSVISIVSFFVLRPYLQKKLAPHEHTFTAESFIGTQAQVIEKIYKDKK